MYKLIPLPSLAAGFITVLVGYTSSAAIIFQAARAAGATPAELASWLMVLGFAMGLTCIGLSLRYRIPVSTAWSTPGAALLTTSLAGYSMGEAIGAFVFSAALITLCGITGWFERAMKYIPLSIAAAMLAGVLLKFGINAFTAMQGQFWVVLPMFLAYLLFKRFLPRYAVVAVLLVGGLLAAWFGLIKLDGVSFAIAAPVWTTPQFSWTAMMGIGLPLFIVTMASQNIPGVAVLRSSGYEPPVSALVGWTGFTNLLLAPFGCFALNLAAITAAICAGKEAHEDPAQRYRASVAAGGFYLLLGLLGGSVGALFAAFPTELVLAIAGIALFGALSSGLALAMREDNQREPALITFLVTASGVSLGGIGSAFWGLVAGVLALVVLNLRAAKPKAA
ncbi:benzoate/H(+) symporter BenE family transporter [Chitinimonas viridis]|uniref:Benzoate/H(+) symporter BenE family transporter n=1 Tax=Chitinimonas viridis TaxID=664880 RepID=A0ABT8B7A2_9NEIS|nr:benzoate/H(+) symporter BenE family transporter [Chitinimonas viridis]MDN3577379.1 benzoate/H(+) symporter BenE family transporter [Chitinimonas viridis]